MATTLPLSTKQFVDLTKPLIGLPLSRVWRGYGSAIFLEVGALTEVKRRRSNGETKTVSIGQFTIMIEWSWRVERPQSIYFGSWSTTRIIDSRLDTLKSRIITGINVEGRLPELVVELSERLWVHSFATAEGQPEWCIFLGNLHPREWIVSRRGNLLLQKSERA